MNVQHELDLLRDATRAALISGSAASAVSAAALALGGQIEEESPAGPINGPSQWVWGEEEARTREPTLKHTALGYAIHHGTSLMWGTVYERLFSEGRERKSAMRIFTEAAAATGLAYFVDYYLTPKRFRPGFKKHLSAGSVFSVYAGFAAGLAITSVLQNNRARRRVTSRTDLELSSL